MQLQTETLNSSFFLQNRCEAERRNWSWYSLAQRFAGCPKNGSARTHIPHQEGKVCEGEPGTETQTEKYTVHPLAGSDTLRSEDTVTLTVTSK